MGLIKFLEKFLPDCEARMKEIKELHNKEVEYFDALDVNAVALIVAGVYFPKALQNFTDKICEKQREICETEVMKRIEKDPDVVANVIYTKIINAPQPKIKKL
jgi:hypothetical protein